MSESLITRNDAALTVTFGPEAEARKEDALASGLAINAVCSPEQQQRAVDVQLSIKSLLSDVERERKRVKQPILDFGRAIDSTCKSWVEGLTDELNRIAKLNGAYAAEQEAIRRKAEQEAESKRHEELARIEAERKAEEDRIAKEAQARIDAAKAEAATQSKAEAEAKAEQLKAELEAQSKAAAERAERARAEAIANTTVAAPVKAEGQRVRTDWEITVTNPHLLAQKHPHLCDIKPRLLDIKDELNAGRRVEGIKAERVTKSSVTVRGSRNAINV